MSSNLGYLFCSIINAPATRLHHHTQCTEQKSNRIFYQITVHLITFIHYILKKHVNQDKGKNIMHALLTLKKCLTSIGTKDYSTKLIESGIGGKTNDLINQCTLKVNVA